MREASSREICTTVCISIENRHRLGSSIDRWRHRSDLVSICGPDKIRLNVEWKACYIVRSYTLKTGKGGGNHCAFDSFPRTPGGSTTGPSFFSCRSGCSRSIMLHFCLQSAYISFNLVCPSKKMRMHCIGRVALIQHHYSLR